MPKPTWRARLEALADRLDTITGRAAASAVLVGMLIFCVVLFLKLDRKRSAEEIRHKFPPAAGATPAPATAPTSNPVADAKVHVLTEPAEPSPFGLKSEESGSTVNTRSKQGWVEELTLEDLRRRR